MIYALIYVLCFDLCFDLNSRINMGSSESLRGKTDIEGSDGIKSSKTDLEFPCFDLCSLSFDMCFNLYFVNIAAPGDTTYSAVAISS